MVGRDAEVARLRRATDTSTMSGAVVLVGEAGIGKSAVLRESVDSDRLCLVRCLPPVSAALAPIAMIVADLLRRGANHTHSGLGAYAESLEALLPGSSRQQPSPIEHGHPVVLGDAILRLWSTVPVPLRPVLAVEDLHWSDPESIAVILRAIERAPAIGVPLLITTRPEGDALPGLRRLFADRIATEIALDPLDDAAVGEMAAACLNVAPQDLPSGLTDHLASAGGLPLHVEAVLSDLTEVRALRKVDGEWLMDAPREVPATIERLVDARLDALAFDHRCVVEQACLAPGHIDVNLTASARATTPREVATALTVGVTRGLIDQDRQTGQFWFRHELIREAVLGSLDETSRRHYSAAALAALGPRRTAPDAAHLAMLAALTHWAEGPQPAAALYLALARLHLTHSAPLSAASAAETAWSTGPVTMQAEARAVLVEAAALAGDADRALEQADRLRTELDAGTATLSRERMNRVTEAVIRAVAHKGEWSRADQLLQEALVAPPPSTVALAALVALELGRFEEAEASARQALTDAANGPAACEAMEVLGRLARHTDLDLANSWFARAEAVARADGLHMWRARALHELATISQLRSLDVDAHYEARAAAVDAGAPGLVSAVDFHIAALHGVRFEAAPALEAGRRLLTDARSRGAIGQEAWAWILIGQAHAVLGQRVQAEATATEALSLAPDDHEIRGVAVGTCQGLPALLADDDVIASERIVSAIAELRHLPRVGAVPPWYLWPILATVRDLEGDGGQAARDKTRNSDLRVTPGPDALWYLAEAVALGRRGDQAGAREQAAAAAARFQEVPSFAGWRHLGHRWVAEDAVAAEWGEPGRWMVAADAFFTERGFERLAARCRGLARKAGAPQRRRRAGGTPIPEHLNALGVTGREVDVLRLVADGLTNAEIAERLVLSPRTVKGYVEQLLARTGATNRTKLTQHLHPQDPPFGGSRTSDSR